MKLLPRRKSGASLTLSPQTPVRPTETVTASVKVDDAIDGITAARVELGYVNGYRYRWAGRTDAAAHTNDLSIATMGQVGTNYGSEKDTEDWVHVLEEPLPVAGGTLGAGTYTAALRLPSWAPGSSDDAVRWQVRLRVERSGRDVEEDATITVLSVPPEPPPAELPLVPGNRIGGNELDFDITTERTCYRPGETVSGVVRLTAVKDLSKRGELAISFVRHRLSHPLEKTPGSETEAFTRPHLVVAKDIVFNNGVTVELPFSAVLPEGSDPTTEAVHSSLQWYVYGRVMFEGLTGGVESARRGIVVHTG